MEIRNIQIHEVAPSPMNPRKTFDEAALKELADNIRQQGLLQPITVRPAEMATQMNHTPGVKYEVVCGERRYRAVKALNEEDPQKWPGIACIVREMNDAEAFDAMITENLQRKDVDPIEEAYAFLQLQKAGSTVEEIAARFGKSVRFVRDRIKLNDLIPELLVWVKDGKMAIVAAMVMSKFSAEMQAKFAKAYANNDSVSKHATDIFLDGEFRAIKRASWYRTDNPADQDFEGGCGRKCRECQYNTANANCLFWEMNTNAEDGKCSCSVRYEAKHIAFLLAYLESIDSDLVKKGEELAYGKTVIVDNSNCWNNEMKRAHKNVFEAIAAKGYEVVTSEVFNGRVYYQDGDERIEQLLKDGEAYRVIDPMSYSAFAAPNVCYYYTAKKSDSTKKGDLAPTEVTQLVGKYKKNIEALKETIAKKQADLVATIEPTDGELNNEELRAFDMLVLDNLQSEFMRKRYGVTTTYGSHPKPSVILEIVTKHPEDRQLWYREFIRQMMARGAFSGTIYSEVANDLLPIWRKDETEEIRSKAEKAARTKNEKIKARLEELGYDTDGKKLVEREEPAFADREPLKVQFEEMKRKHPDALLLYRIGDFYEAFHEDADTCAEILKLTIFKKPDRKGFMNVCGFPHHALESYLPKLIRAGKRVAICEQLDKR